MWHGHWLVLHGRTAVGSHSVLHVGSTAHYSILTLVVVWLLLYLSLTTSVYIPVLTSNFLGMSWCALVIGAISN